MLIDEPATADDAFELLFRHNREHPGGVLWRGEERTWDTLRCSLDRALDVEGFAKNSSARREREREVALEFRRCARSHLGIVELAAFRDPFRPPAAAAMQVQQHFGVPTRLVDWTWNPLVALWMAVHTCSHEDGQIRVVDFQELRRLVDARWSAVGAQRLQDGEVHMDELLLTDGEWLSPLTLRVPFPRMYAQAGCFTIAGTFGLDHARWLSENLPHGAYRVIRVRADFKPELRAGLTRLGVEAQSLQSPIVDDIGRLLKGSIGKPEAPHLLWFEHGAVHVCH
jgi:hypothetical protein